MNKLLVITPLAVLSGFLVGHFAASLPSEQEESQVKASPPDKMSERGTAEQNSRKSTAAIATHLVSTETLESILEQGDKVTYASLALWLVDAKAEDMAEYWRRVVEPNWDKKRLLFMNWTRIDPQGALAATEGSEFSKTAWWSWATNDPAAAMAAARTDEQMAEIANGLGQSQPAWLIEHFDELPEAVKSNAFDGLTTWKEADDPAAILDFLLEKNRGFQSHVFKNFARKDPWAAYEWLEKNGKLGLSQSQSGGIEILLRETSATSPDDLERMAAITPAGQLKRRIEDAVFENLMKTDPEKAYENARKTESPMFATKRMAMIAAGHLDTDPEKAFSIAGEILAKAGDGLSPKTIISVGNHSSSWGQEKGESEKFFQSLIAKDPARTLDLASAAVSEKPGDTFQYLAATWAETDLASYSEWVNKQTEPEIKKVAIYTVVSSLAKSGHFKEAGDWAVSSPDANRNLQILAWRWGRSDPNGAREWLNTADIPQNQKQQLLDQISNQ